MRKIMVAFGTRPDTIKMCPLVLELKSRPDVQVVVAVTGQHREMLSTALVVFGVTPDYNLEIMSENQTLFDITEKTLAGMRELLQREKPDILLVHGDTTTAFASALAAFYLGIRVGHVEAGLRTYDMNAPYPEEFNRQAVDSIAEIMFAPTEAMRYNLIREGKSPESVFVTGNTELDALRYTVRDDYSHPELDWAADSRLIVMTAHRRESLGDGMRGMFRAIRRVTDEFGDVKIVYPVHLNPAVRAIAEEALGGHPRIHLIEPPDAYNFHNLMARSYFILTDSGGIQESAPALGKPVLVLRDATERPEGIIAGTLRLAGTSEDNVYAEFCRLLTDDELYESMSRAENPYGDGFASKRIADALLDRIYSNLH